MNLEMLLIIAANVALSYKGFEDTAFFNRYKFNIGAIRQGEKIRLLSSGFLHASWEHLIFNMLSFYFFAPVILYNLDGKHHLSLIYFISLLMGNAISLYIYKNNNRYSAVGASGAVTGVIYSAILMEPQSTIFLFFIPVPALLFGFAYLGYSIYKAKENNDNIGHTAHIGGAIGGILYSVFVVNHIDVVTLSVLVVPILVFLYLIYNNKI